MFRTWPILEQLSDAAADLAGCLRIHSSDQFDESILKSCVLDTVRGTKIYLAVPDKLRKNIEFDIPVMQKKREKLVNELEKMNKRLSYETYSVKTSPEQQKEHSRKVNSSNKIFRTFLKLFNNIRIRGLSKNTRTWA